MSSNPRVNQTRKELGGQWDFNKNSEAIQKKLHITTEVEWKEPFYFNENTVYEGEVIQGLNIPTGRGMGLDLSSGTIVESWYLNGKSEGQGRTIFGKDYE